MADRIVFKRRGQAQRKLRSVRKRMESWPDKENLVTSDPMLAEIQLGQLEALMSIGHSMAALEASIEVTVDEKVYKGITETWAGRIVHLEQEARRLRVEIEELMVLVKSMHGTQILDRNKPSWWDRIWKGE